MTDNDISPVKITKLLDDLSVRQRVAYELRFTVRHHSSHVPHAHDITTASRLITKSASSSTLLNTTNLQNPYLNDNYMSFITRSLRLQERITTIRQFSITSRTMASSNPANQANPLKDPNEQPSMIGGHAQYVKGYVEETVGNVTGSKEWVDSGKKDAQAGIETMKVCSFHIDV